MLASALGAALAVAAAAQDDLSTPEIRTETVAANVHVLLGGGGNIGMLAGPDGIFLVDDGFAALIGTVRSAVAQLSDEPVRFVINTHWHSDHTGGNEKLSEAGALIVAHENVRRRMMTGQFMVAFNRTIPPSSPAALPVVTFDRMASFHINGETVQVIHVEHAHTDGDTLVHFTRADVIHMGDTFFANGFPFIDLPSGGSVLGMIAAADRALALGGPNTRYIPGHGPVSDRTVLAAYRGMLRDVTDTVRAGIEARLSVEAIVAARPTASHDARWASGFVTPEQFVRTIYASLTVQADATGSRSR